jgi:hypothetical protein
LIERLQQELVVTLEIPKLIVKTGINQIIEEAMESHAAQPVA